MNNCGAGLIGPRRFHESMSEQSPTRIGAFGALMSRPYALLILCNLFWGGNVVAGKAAVGNIDPYALMVLRWAGAALLVLPFAIEPIRRDWPIIRAKWWLYLVYGAVGYATCLALCYVAA